MKICNVCDGTQNLVSFQYGFEKHDCPACKHWGVRFAKIKDTPDDLERLKQ